MVNVDEAIIARMKKSGEVFEILVDCDKALELKGGKNIDLGDVVATRDIFKDVKKGDKASENEIKRIFNTNNFNDVAKIIIKEGEIQLTTEHKSKIREEKRKQIVNIIHRNAIDSQTGLPHPPIRIENAMNEAKVNVDVFKRAEDQVNNIVDALRKIIPIKFEKRQIEIIVPAKFAGQSYHILKSQKLLKDEWQSDGSLLAVVEIPAGIQEEFFNELNKLAHGEVETKIIKKE